MNLKVVSERRPSGRRITGAFKSLPMFEPLSKRFQAYESSSKRSRKWAFFAIGFAAGIIGFVLLYLR